MYWIWMSPCLWQHRGCICTNSFGPSNLKGMLVIQVNHARKGWNSTLICCHLSIILTIIVLTNKWLYYYSQITPRIVGCSFSTRLTAPLNLCLIYLKLLVLVQHRGCICTKLLQVHMHKKFEVNRTKIKGDVSRVQKLQPTILSVINL